MMANKSASPGSSLGLRSWMGLIGIITAFFISGSLIFVLAASMPAVELESVSEETGETIKHSMQLSELNLPTTLARAQEAAHLLQVYRDAFFSELLVLFAAVYLFKQTFSIPGSVFMNLLAGSLFGVRLGFPMCCLLTACGASCCYALSNLFGHSLAQLLFSQEKINKMASTIEKQNKQNNLFFYCLFCRLFPMSPNFFFNIVSPLVDVPFHIFFFSVLFGLVPYIYITVSAGVIITQITHLKDAVDNATLLKLGCISLLALCPILLKSKLRRLGEYMQGVTAQSSAAIELSSSSLSAGVEAPEGSPLRRRTSSTSSVDNRM